jgi:hypothetical protein
VVGISMLTLVPRAGRRPRDLRARSVGRLARVGERGYHAFVPTIAPDPRDGLPIMVVHEDHDG